MTDGKSLNNILTSKCYSMYVMFPSTLTRFMFTLVCEAAYCAKYYGMLQYRSGNMNLYGLAYI